MSTLLKRWMPHPEASHQVCRALMGSPTLSMHRNAVALVMRCERRLTMRESAAGFLVEDRVVSAGPSVPWVRASSACPCCVPEVRAVSICPECVPPMRARRVAECMASMHVETALRGRSFGTQNAPRCPKCMSEVCPLRARRVAACLTRVRVETPRARGRSLGPEYMP